MMNFYTLNFKRFSLVYPDITSQIYINNVITLYFLKNQNKYNTF